MASRKRVAVVLGAGSVKCAAAIGLARVLAREGIPIDMLVGTSGGSMFAAAIAQRQSSEEATALVTRLWTRELTARRDRRAWMSALLPRLLGFDERFGLKSDAGILAGLRAAFGAQRIEELPIPLLVTATDFHTGEQLVFSQGPLVEAIRASIAIPFVFKPWVVDGRTCIDGFMSDPLPIVPAIRAGADVIIAMGFESPMQESIRSPARFAFQLTAIMNNNLQRARFAFHGATHRGELIAIDPTFEGRVRLFDTARIPDIIRQGERATEAVLPALHRLLGDPAPALAAA